MFLILYCFTTYVLTGQIMQIDKNAEALRLTHDEFGHSYISFWQEGDQFPARRKAWLGFESDGNHSFYITLEEPGNFIYLITHNGYLLIEDSGRLRTNPGGLDNIGDRRNMQYDPETGYIGYDNSSRIDKIKVSPLIDSWNKIFDLSPVQYAREHSPDYQEIGYIAEDVDSIGLNNLVGYSKDGKPQDVRYDRLTLYLVELVKKQQTQINLLMQQTQMQQKRISKLESNQ